MTSAIGSRSPMFLIAPLVALSLIWSDALRAQEEAQLPDYVIEQFGEPPEVPEGPLSEDLKAAVQVAFVDSVTQSTWGSDQTAALQEIAKSGDPRLAWIISDLASRSCERLLGISGLQQLLRAQCALRH